MFQLQALPFVLNNQALIPIPPIISDHFPSRGMVMGVGSLNGVACHFPFEPDGQGSHYYVLDSDYVDRYHLTEGLEVSLEFEVTKDWIEPEAPQDLLMALESQNVYEAWLQTTVIARWDFIRWIRSTKNPDTRAKRIFVCCDKLKKGDKRPCCFDRSRCTEPYLSKNGILNLSD